MVSDAAGCAVDASEESQDPGSEERGEGRGAIVMSDTPI